MNNLEKKIYKALYENALIFLKDGIERLVLNDDNEKDTIEHGLFEKIGTATVICY